MYWIDNGAEPKIERASLDGSDRNTLQTTGLSRPNGIAIDYIAQRIYWTDSNLLKIESSLYDGSRREKVVSFERLDRIVAPYSIALEQRAVYWTDVAVNTIYAVSKESIPFQGNDTVVFIYNGFTDNVTALLAISPSRQHAGKKYDMLYHYFMLLSLIM